MRVTRQGKRSGRDESADTAGLLRAGPRATLLRTVAEDPAVHPDVVVDRFCMLLQ
jgi:hypothetical protein